MDEHYRKLEHLYLKAKCQTEYYETITIKISERKAILTLSVLDKYFHAMQAVHGSVYFKLLDDASYFAVNSIFKDAFLLTTSFNINLVRPVNKGIITAIGTVKHTNKNQFIGEAELFNEENKLLAFGSGTFVKSKFEIKDKVGYQ